MAQNGGVIKIRSDETYYNAVQLTSKYHGNVEITQGNYSIFADEAEISERESIAKLIGQPLEFSAISSRDNEQDTITALEAIVDFGKREIKLVRRVRAEIGDVTLTADRVTYNVETGEIHAVYDEELTHLNDESRVVITLKSN